MSTAQIEGEIEDSHPFAEIPLGPSQLAYWSEIPQRCLLIRQPLRLQQGDNMGVTRTARSKSNHRYPKIESVVISFGADLSLIKKHTLVLRATSPVLDFDTAIRLSPVVLTEGTEALLLPDVWMEPWSTDTLSRDQCIKKLTEAAAVDAIADLADIPFVTYLDRHSGANQIYSYNPINALTFLRQLNELNWMRCSGWRPKWYDASLHAEAFELEEDAASSEYIYEIATCFTGPHFQRRLKADKLLQQLDGIPESTPGATAFHDWVFNVFALLFSDDLVRMRKHPNGNAPERRDIVATNVHHNKFWQRLYTEYKVSMTVIEAKNISEIGPDAYRQVYSYLDRPHYGNLGFLVARKEDTTPAATDVEAFKHYHDKTFPHKLIVLLPSAFSG